MKMTSKLPITLIGDNLGKRHKQINSLVKNAYDGNEDFKIIQNVPEKSAIDRLFKIDLASSHRDVDYIINNLKENDMLYVSRALKSKWLLETEYQDFINPEYLEVIYAGMITTAVTKMKHWIYLNLKDKQRAQEFYKYYYEKEFQLAMKFLVKSSDKFIEKEFSKIVLRVSPKYFKLLCEKSPQIAKIFFDLLASDETLKSRYLNDEKKFYNSMKCLLKSDPNLYLDITEKYFNLYQFDRFSSIATKFIMTHHKDRFLKKLELYTAWILDVATLAECLNVNEVKDLVEKLARAQFLQTWFEFKNVEPLIKRLKPEDRATFKKKVFVDKNVGDKVEEWPYEPPSAPQTEDLGPDIFEDSRHEPYEYERLGGTFLMKRKLMKKKGNFNSEIMMCDMISCEKVKTELDKLFDEYRFVGFEQTFYELQKRILAESSPQNRQYIMLVLISKTGGRADAIASLMKLLARHSNEPPNLRATIIRSLVKRAFVWRLPEETWQQLIKFGQGLGLDGGVPESDCIEGLHSVLIRSMLQNKNCNADIFNAFLGQFSDLSRYALTVVEKKCVSVTLPKLLLSAAKEKDKVGDAVDLINKLTEVLGAYKIKVETYPDLIPTVVHLAKTDYTACMCLLENLFNGKIGRKALFLFSFKFIKTDASHLNALKHDISVLDFEIFYESCMNLVKFEQFIRKIVIYFNEDGGLAMQYRNNLQVKEHNKSIGRYLTMLLGSELEQYLQILDKEIKVESKVFASTIRANSHMARPSIDIDTFGWRKAGVKMIANNVITCTSIDVEKNILKLLEWKRTARLALVLSKRTQKVTDVFIVVAKLRPTIGIKLGIELIKKNGNNFDIKVWETIKPLIQNIDFTKDMKKKYVKKVLSAVEAMPMKIRPEYSIIIFKAFEKMESLNRYSPMPHLCRIEHVLPSIDEEFIEKLLIKFFENDFIPDKLRNSYDDNLCNSMYIRIIFTYIFLSKTAEVEKRRFETFGNKLLDRMTEILNFPNKRETFFLYLDEILLNFKNTKVFLNPEYVSCLSAMEKTASWMQTILPIEQYFDRYVTIHLTMLYYKAIRQTMKQAPEVFENERRTFKEGVKTVGNLFGKYIAKEVKELMAKFFESVVYLYKDTLLHYLDNYFNYVQSSDFLSSIIKGILEEGKDEVRLGMYMLIEKKYNLKEDVSAEISESFGELEDLKNKFFVFGEIFA